MDIRDRKAVCLLSGGNIDVSVIHRIVELGLVTRHRRLKFAVRLPDTPGSLMHLLQVIADSGANILTINHDRMCLTLSPNEILVHIACEVGGQDHADSVVESVTSAGYSPTLE